MCWFIGPLIEKAGSLFPSNRWKGSRMKIALPIALCVLLIAGCDKRPKDSEFGAYVERFYKEQDEKINAGMAGSATNKTWVLSFDLQKTNSITSPFQYEVSLWRQVSIGKST